MFTTCIHCNQDLGRNDAFEVFPVGTRLAFDAAKGRLWVICRRCDRWNLSPLDERWEAIEDAERRAMDGELSLLEAAWREAEEIAQIADTMFVPATVESRLAQLRRGDGPPPAPDR